MQSPSPQRRSGTPVQASYRQLRRAKAAEEQRWQVEPTRSGLLGAWLNLAAPPPASALASFAERERLRKAELSAYVAFGVFLIGLALVPNALQHTSNLYAIPAIMAAGVAAAALNRTGFTRTAAIILISVFFVAIGGAMAASPNLDLMWIPALDFFAVPVFLSGLLLSRRAPFGAVALGAALVAALLLLKPRDPWLTHMVAQLGIYHFMVRPIGLMLIVAIASWLWGRSMEQAIMRADRAEEVAAMEHQLAEQKRQLDRGIQNLLETHVRVSNGDFSARAATNQDNMLWQIAVSLNNLLSRLGKYSHIEQRLGRTEAEIDRLAGAMEATRTGRHANWPMPSGTRVDRLLALVTGHQQQVAPAPALTPTQVWPAAYPHRASRPTRAGRAHTLGNMEGGYTGPITGEWREVTGRHADNGERQTEQMRSAPWSQSQTSFGPAMGGQGNQGNQGNQPAHGSQAFWHEPPRQAWGGERAETTNGQAAGHQGHQAGRWAMDPLPPLPGTEVPGAPVHASVPSRGNSTPPPRGGTFSESFPGQLREGASWEGLREMRPAAEDGLNGLDGLDGQALPSEAPSAPGMQGDANNWPDWPDFLRSLDAQGNE